MASLPFNVRLNVDLKQIQESISVADVLNKAGLTGGPYEDGYFWVTCPSCSLEQTLWHATKKSSEDPTRITEYRCRDCETVLCSVVHWGLAPQPLQNHVYRLHDDAIDTPVDPNLSVPGKAHKVKLPADMTE